MILVSLYQCLTGTEAGAFKNGHYMFVLVDDVDVVQTSRLAIVYLPGFRCEDVAYMYRLYEVDGSVKCY